MLIFAIMEISGCAHKPFQPTPAEFMIWQKNNTSEDEVKSAMLFCGYPNVGGFSGVDASFEERTSAEECMFKSGFFHRDGSLGTCASKGRREALAACHEK
ncbi:hypothetical protein GTP58_28850 [Duganella sp. CY15W]|uniref:hypothetical protein n=1 Tax=Duganella sp. CY15W TaxID=2692172 RepID=UPI001370A1A7|nr:hypothetical protein [Duganella sp. CY15W]MYM32347.1 hypothetical protein [Duganella sp. CY15W]